MADDKSNRGAADRAKVAGGEDYEVEYLAKKLGVTQARVRAAIKKVGNNRAAVEAEIKKNP
nr:DUF3606 domain-containing protein [uncultured Roseateles sp.]